MLKKLFFLPGKNIPVVIPILLIIGFITGSLIDTSFLKKGILLGTFFMIYPTMIGFNLRSAFDLSHGRVLLWSFLINFLLIPIVAMVIGKPLLENPELFAGLAISALLPTSGMTISWTMLSKGNVPAAIKITAISLILGSILAPIYLKFMAGTMVDVDVVNISKTIMIIVFLPMILGQFTSKFLRSRFSEETFRKEIKPYFPAVSVWAMMFVIFASISMKAPMLYKRPDLIVDILIAMGLFYLINIIISTIIGRLFFTREDGLALVFGTILRNLSIALGIAIATFGPLAGLTVTIAFIIQVQISSWYGKLANKYSFFKESSTPAA